MPPVLAANDRIGRGEGGLSVSDTRKAVRAGGQGLAHLFMDERTPTNWSRSSPTPAPLWWPA